MTSFHAYPTTFPGGIEQAREQAASVLGPGIARRLRAFENGVLYIGAPPGRAFMAWLVDLAVVWGAAVAPGIASFFSSSAPDAATGALTITVFLLLVVPFLYGWCYRNGRALGAVLMGTRLVRVKDGGRIGWGKAGWAMMVRTIFMPFVIFAIFEGGSFDHVRTSIDDAATRRLWAAGFQRLR